MKRIIYDYEKPHIVGRARGSSRGARTIVFILAISLAVTLIYVLFFKDKSVKSEAQTFYAVISGQYDNEIEAVSAADQIRQKGGGGYIADGEVVVAVYPSDTEAQAVADRYGYKVVSTGEYKLRLRYDQRETGEQVQKLYMLPEEIFESIYSATVALDSNQLSEAAALYVLQSATKKLNSAVVEIEELKQEYSSDKLLDELLAAYSDLASSLSEQSPYSFSSRLKYCGAKVVFTYKKLLILAT
ncbi:MAG: hypothetical protein E7350_00935 [Clostridiales bacterium]|nr:hypothetical protein [Clostridiales bacterium]